MELPTVSCPDLFSFSDYVLIDTRSPSEYAAAHIAGAVSLPLMDDFERHIIGLTFKQEGRHEAIRKGFEIFASKLQDFCSHLLTYKDKKIIVYCARGGLRSQLVVEFFCNKEKIREMIHEVGANVASFYEQLLSLEPLEIYQLVGGYKAYRNFLLERFSVFDYPFTFCVLHGLTAVGKSAVLEEIREKGCAVIHLEELAQHTSSVFGSVGRTPVSQQMFESQLLSVLEGYRHEHIVFIEGEARKVGNVILPEKLYARMHSGVAVLLTASMQDRIQRLLREYFNTPQKVLEVRAAMQKLIPHMGGEKIAYLTSLLDAGDYVSVSRSLLVDHYDNVYACTLTSLPFVRTFTEKDRDAIISFARDYIR